MSQRLSPPLPRMAAVVAGIWFLAGGPTAILEAAEPLDTSPAAVEARLDRDLRFLASDELEGRGIRTRGLDQAAEFIAREFQSAGLRTDHFNGTPFHDFTVYSAGSTGAVQSLTWSASEREQALQAGDDFTSLLVTTSGNFELPMVFAGYGITDPQRGYDDYAGLDVRGKAVIVLRHEPQARQPESPFDGVEHTTHAYLLTKIRNAARHGAAALVLCTDAANLEVERPEEAGQGAREVDPLLDVELTSGLETESLPVVHCRRSIVAGWVRETLQRDLSVLEKEIDATLQPQSAALPGCRLQGRVALTRPGRRLRNVIATLETDGPLREETIVIGAHYDHLGRGGWGSLAIGATNEVHNGADDNASGTVVMLEAARQLATMPRRRRVVFAAFTGEELGLYGSKRYVQAPLVPLNQTVAMLNLDMVGRLREDRLTVYGTGTADEWPQFLSAAAQSHELRIVSKPSGFGPSDHAPFHERGVPVLHLFTGFHREYHRPNDDAELVNVAGMRRIAALLLDLVQQIDAAPERIHPSTHDQPFQFADIGSLDGLLSSSPPRRPGRLGVLLRPRESGSGLEILEVERESLAEEIGLLPGDVLLRWDGRTLDSSQALRDALQERVENRSRALEFERGGVVRELNVSP